MGGKEEDYLSISQLSKLYFGLNRNLFNPSSDDQVFNVFLCVFVYVFIKVITWCIFIKKC